MGDEEIVHPSLTKKPYFDINHSIEELGLDFDNFKADNFHTFVDNITTDLISLRKHYIIKDLVKVRGLAHKMKGVFL